MKNVLFFLLVSLMMVACADDRRFVVRGNDKGFTDGYKVYMLCEQGDCERPVLFATAVIKNNSFEIDGIAEKPFDAIVAVCDSTHIDEQTMELLSEDARPFSLNLFVEPGEIVITPYDWEQNAPAKASGTPLNDLYNRFVADVDSVKKNIGDDPETMFSFVVPFILKNIDNAVGVTVFDCWHWSMPKEMKLEILDSLEACYGDKYSELRADTRAELQHQQMRDKQREAVGVGCKYKDIKDVDADGRVLSLSGVVENPKNRYVLLEFWATWCRPCMAEVSNLLDAYKNYNGKGFDIYAVSLDDDADAWGAAIKERGMQWANVLTRKGSDACDKYGITGAGVNFLIDCATGEIVATDLRGDALQKKLNELLD